MPPHPSLPEAKALIEESGAERRWFDLFNDQRKFWRLCTAVFCAFAVIKGSTAPSSWALTQSEVDYSHGFVKRGLEGAVLGALQLRHHSTLDVIYFLQLVVLFVLLCLLTRAAQPEKRFGNYAPVAVFASCYAVTFMTHIVGYADVVLASLAALILLVRDPAKRFWTALFVVPVALLVHEAFLLMFMPAILFSFVLRASWVERSKRKKLLVYAAIIAALAFGITVASSLTPHLTPAEAAQFRDEAIQRADFQVMPFLFDILARPLSGSLQEAWVGIRNPDWLMPDIVTFVNYLPAALFLLCIGKRLLRAAASVEHQKLLWRAFLAAVLFPLLLYILGFDGARWNTACMFALFMLLMMLCRDLPEGSITLSRGEMNAAVLVMAINMACGMGLFGNDDIVPFPFFPHLWSSFR